jgi:hypothetical protein
MPKLVELWNGALIGYLFPSCKRSGNRTYRWAVRWAKLSSREVCHVCEIRVLKAAECGGVAATACGVGAER